jgi:hypothetical protein
MAACAAECRCPEAILIDPVYSVRKDILNDARHLRGHQEDGHDGVEFGYYDRDAKTPLPLDDNG